MVSFSLSKYCSICLHSWYHIWSESRPLRVHSCHQKPWGCLHHVWLLVWGSYLCIPLLGDATRIERHRNERDLFWFNRTTKLNPRKTWVYLYDRLQTVNDFVCAWALEEAFYVAVVHVDFYHVVCAVSLPQKPYYQWFQIQN